MPNWCNNDLRIRGDKKTLDKIRKKLFDKDGNFTFTALIPEELDNPKYRVDPEKEHIQPEDRRPDGTCFDWYNFHIDKWGTKWDVNGPDCCVTNEDTYIQIGFDTANWLPDKWFDRLVAKFPEADIQMASFEPGCFIYWINGVRDEIDVVPMQTRSLAEVLGDEAKDVDLEKLREKFNDECCDWCLCEEDLFDPSTWYYDIYDEDRVKKLAKQCKKEKK